MNENEKWLKNRLKISPILDEGEKQCIDRLNSKHTSEADLSSCIDALEVLLSLDALPALLNFMKTGKHSMPLRKQAAKTISVIGSSYIETELTVLRASSSSKLRLLAEIALGIKSPNVRE
jgi:hypothetical protein